MMWRIATSLAFASLFVSSPAWSQAAGQRPQPPQAAQGWTPTAPLSEKTTAKQAEPADPWQLGAPAQGIQYGQFTLYPAVTGGGFYDDNVFATHSNRQGTWGAFVRPELGVKTAGQNYAVEASGVLEDRWYSRFSSEDQLNAATGVAATVMLDPNTQVIAKGGYQRAHEARGTGDSTFTGFDEPVGYNVFNASGTLNKRFNRWWTSLGVAGSWINYDTPTIGGVPVDQSYRDGTIGVVTGRVGYVVAPLTSVFIEWSGNRRNFEVDVFDSSGYRVVGGVLLEPGQGARIKGEAYAGYMYQNYEGTSFQTVSSFTYGGALAWAFAPRWTAAFEGSRVALESGLNGGVSVIESLGAARVDYQVLPNVVVGAGASYLSDQYLGANRTDSSWSPLASVKYLVTPNLTLGIDYRNVSFDSSGFGVLTYYRNVYLLSLNARL
jgi:hypothetical protein